VIGVALKTPLENNIGNFLYSQNFTFASARWLYWFYIKLSTPTFYNKIAPMLSRVSSPKWTCNKNRSILHSPATRPELC